MCSTAQIDIKNSLLNILIAILIMILNYVNSKYIKLIRELEQRNQVF